MGLWQRLVSRAGTLRQLLAFLWQQRLWWLIPMLAVLVLFIALLLFTQSSALSPFVYTLF